MTLRLSGGRRLLSPPGATARPTAARVRQAVLNLLSAELPACRWLDLCCGSGVMACEALQRGAAEVVAVERDRRIAAVARTNLEAVASGLGQSRPTVRVIQAEAGRWLRAHGPGLSRSRSGDGRPGEEASNPTGASGTSRVQDGGETGPERPFDLVYLDPPWPAGLHVPLSEALARGGWISPDGTLVWECPSDQVPIPPQGWRLRDQRRYGGSTVVLLQPESRD